MRPHLSFSGPLFYSIRLIVFASKVRRPRPLPANLLATRMRLLQSLSATCADAAGGRREAPPPDLGNVRRRRQHFAAVKSDGVREAESTTSLGLCTCSARADICDKKILFQGGKKFSKYGFTFVTNLYQDFVSKF